MEWLNEIELYQPYDEEEKIAKQTILDFCHTHDNVYYRECLDGHITSTGFVINKEHTKVLMAFHNIYQSYSWTGGHNDGDTDSKYVATKEVLEETGLPSVKRISELISLDDLPVPEHTKHDKLVKEHRHFNLTYLFEADENDKVSIKEDENSALKWIEFGDLDTWVSEKEMLVVYKKIIERIKAGNYLHVE